MAFSGFSTDQLISLPPELFSDVLPAISLPSELKVTLHVFYRLNKQRGSPRRIAWADLAADPVLRRGLRSISPLRPVEELLAEGLDSAVRRLTLLHVLLPEAEQPAHWYLVNTAANRAWVAETAQVQAVLAPEQSEPPARPSLATLYEQNIGLVTPLLVEELREAAEHYPYEWIADAMREAVRANARSWRYIRKVLERWATHGRQDAPDYRKRPIDVEKYLSGPDRHLFRRGGSADDELSRTG